MGSSLKRVWEKYRHNENRRKKEEEERGEKERVIKIKKERQSNRDRVRKASEVREREKQRDVTPFNIYEEAVLLDMLRKSKIFYLSYLNQIGKLKMPYKSKILEYS